ncbi:TAXI family TRAP transporter solute-binding subunit [Hydrogenoanaerobacterium sp.]|uniref:TAXI family TRAP transporter solute-binding subunit n=1 Tax=Hydrogenoanaerobacterium sp. TaxID=2953763 RepID=UPI002898CA9D|nr:TAXI family TRAP transporter solute-binding subunit [Hydrogenoanaerobacterium sp.]
MKKIFALLMACTLSLSLFACSGSGNSNNNGENTGSGKNGVKKYSVASGSVGGNFYLIGGGVATAINGHAPDKFMFTSETTGGSTANLTMLQNSDAELGIAMTSSLSEAAEGKADWTNGKPLDNLRSALALYPSWLTIYTLDSSGIKSLSDLNGKIVGLGSKGMAMDSVFRQFLESRGITPKQIHNDGHSATASALDNGVIDAAILFSYPPFAAISELESTKALCFVPLSEEEQAALVDTYSFYKADDMPGGSYKAAPEDIRSVSEWNMLASSSSVSADDVYLMVKTLCENQDDMIAVHSSCSYMTAENTLNSNIPLHAGTVRYLKEVGIEVPNELIPPEYTE